MNELITNGTEIKQRIISEVNSAKQSIYIAMAYFTDREIALALVDAKNRNIAVDIILSSNAQNDTVKLILKGAGINVHAFETGDTRGIMHHKFCLIDNKISINGSYNYSVNASNNNVENIQISDDAAIYAQFLTEFNSLKYKIDNRIAVNKDEYTPELETKTEEVQPQNIIETFSKRLNNLVYTSAQINTEKYREEGFKASQSSGGSIDIFSTEYAGIKQKISSFASDEGLGSVKNNLNASISNAFESTKTSLETEKEEKLNGERRKYELKKSQIEGKITELKYEKSILESGNQNTEEKGLLQINKEIDKNKLERKSLDQSLIVKKFWNPETILMLIGFLVFSSYLSLFFASAMYKVFFEENIIRAALEAGLDPGLPQIVDANAIIKIFRQQGALFGFIASIFFLIPVLLSNLKIIGSENKKVNKSLFWVGILIFDVIVSIMVTLNIDEIKSLLVGQESTLKIWHVVQHGEFWMIFVFGMLPLVIMHFIISKLSMAYRSSRREIIDSEKNKKIQNLDEELIDLLSDKESLTIKIREGEELIKEKNNEILNLESELNNQETQLDITYSALLNKIVAIYNDYSSRIISGRIFTEVILNSVVSAYKAGFIEYLPHYYASDEVSRRVKEIEVISATTNN